MSAKIDFPKIKAPQLEFTKYKDLDLIHQEVLFNKLNNVIAEEFASTNQLLNEQLQLALSEAESAKKDAVFSKRIAIASIVVSITLWLADYFDVLSIVITLLQSKQ